MALACVPALAYLAVLALNQLLPELAKLGLSFAALPLGTRQWIQTVTTLAGGGTFLVTSLLWATALAHLIDGRIGPVVATLLLGVVFSWYGIIHSPLPSGPIMAPGAVIGQLEAEGRADAAAGQTPFHGSAAYALTAAALLGLAGLGKRPAVVEGHWEVPA